MSDNEILRELKRIGDLKRIEVKNVLNLEEAAIYCSYTKDYMSRHIVEIPHSLKGNRPYFKKSDLENWLLQDRVMTTIESKGAAALYTATHNFNNN